MNEDSAEGADEVSQGQVRAKRARRPWIVEAKYIALQLRQKGILSLLQSSLTSSNITRGYALRAHPWLPCLAPLALVLAVELEQGVEQDVGAVGDVVWVGEFAGGVTDAAHAGDEDHPDWTKLGHVLRVVAGARGQQFGR